MDNNMLTGPNLKHWLRNLRIVLDFERIAYVLEAPLPLDIESDAPQAELDAFEKWREDSRRARSYMLASMNKELQAKHEKVSNAYDILTALQELYSENPKVVEYELCASVFSMKLREGVPPDDHTLKMITGLGRLDGYGGKDKRMSLPPPPAGLLKGPKKQPKKGPKVGPKNKSFKKPVAKARKANVKGKCFHHREDGH
ncbi:uncharacterized protein LOC116128720 [Pistacia vera]|uniref:uncharacterized protein LOC116128720 n=1 Tax=Pistacia vera TaxID=55513 RepID=UPI001262B872|nr:uncharacterized protein LOC116128720 [Pistacia vera]